MLGPLDLDFNLDALDDQQGYPEDRLASCFPNILKCKQNQALYWELKTQVGENTFLF